jgi:hypothetical protein
MIDIEAIKKLAAKYCVYEEPETVDSYHEYHFDLEGINSFSQECNQQLLSERNECVEEIKRLREALQVTNRLDYTHEHKGISEIITNALSTTDSIKKLIEEVK